MALTGIVFLFPIYKFNPAAAEGESLLNSETPQFAYSRFIKAENELPWLKFNFAFNSNKNSAFMQLQKYKVRTPAVILFVNDDYDSGLLVDFVRDLKSKSGTIEARFVPAEDSSKSYIELTRKKTGLFGLNAESMNSSTIEVYLSDWSKASEIQSYAKTQKFITDVIINDLPL